MTTRNADTIIENENEIIDPERAVATHFGVMPEDPDTIPEIACGDPDPEGMQMRIHNNPQKETMLWRAPNATGWVSGSWKCWGPADQATEGDMSLHVVVYTYGLPSKSLMSDFYNALRDDVNDESGRVLEHAYVTGPDDSEIAAIATFDANQGTEIFMVLGRRDL